MQELERDRKRKKKSLLSKLAGSSNQSSPRDLADSLDSAVNDRTSLSDDYGLEGSRGSSQPKECELDSKDHSVSYEDETGHDHLGNEDEYDWRSQRNFAAAKKSELEDLNEDSHDDDDIDNIDDAAVKWSRGSVDGLKETGVPSHRDDVSPIQSPLPQQSELLNRGRDISDQEYDDVDDDDEQEVFESEELCAATPRSQKSTPSAAVSVLNSDEVTSEESDDVTSEESHPQEESSSTLTSAIMKVFGLITRGQATSESNTLGSTVSTLSGTMTKISTKDARNRYAPWA